MKDVRSTEYVYLDWIALVIMDWILQEFFDSLYVYYVHRLLSRHALISGGLWYRLLGVNEMVLGYPGIDSPSHSASRIISDWLDHGEFRIECCS